METKDQTRQEPVNESVENQVISRVEEKINESSTTSFKKVMRGYNPVEVDEHIEMLHANLAGAQQVLDQQSAELKDSLAFVTRERDQLKAEKNDLAQKAAAFDEKAAELRVAQEELNNLKTRNDRLVENEGVADSKHTEALTQENNQLKNKVESYKAQLSSAEKQKNELAEQNTQLNTANTKLSSEFAKLREIGRAHV